MKLLFKTQLNKTTGESKKTQHLSSRKNNKVTNNTPYNIHSSGLGMYRYLSIGIGGISLFLWYRLVVSVSVNIADTCRYFLSTK